MREDYTKVVKFMEAKYDMKEYAQSAKRLKEEYGIASREDFDAYKKNIIVVKRSQVAVKNIVERQPKGKVLFIMGGNHKESLITECDERGIPISVLE